MQLPRLDIGTLRTYPQNMDVHLSPHQEHRVSEALRSGAYQSPDDVIDRALEVLHAQNEWLAANRHSIEAKISRGIEELDRGEGIPEDQLDEYLAGLKARPK